MARPMTPAEKAQFQGYFPQLDVNAAVVTGENDFAYNCISWTVGVTTAWHWPGSTIQDFDAFYGSYGYVRRQSGPIAAWGHSFTDMLHGSVSGASHGPRWESKCGALLRIQHGRDELTSNTYGHIVAYYAFNWWKYIIEILKRILRRKWWWPMNPTDLRWLDEAVAGMNPGARERFETLFAEWKRGWSDPDVLIHSNPAAVRKLPQFEALAGMGPEILPALARKLADRENFLALQLVDAIAGPAEAKAVSGAAPAGTSEQDRASGTAARLAAALRSGRMQGRTTAR